MILSFKPQFIPKILDGSKLHTIRQDPHNRWRAGRMAQVATGVRTKSYTCHKELQIVSVQRVFMTYAFNDVIEITAGGTYLFGYQERLSFAQNDGFDTWEQFFEWFYPLIQAAPRQELSAKILHFTNLRY